ncbi:hypothetical protein, partial [Stutzerimonas balearica]|uniref:hypothetical protein n=1 Tax=Stutzerimonas balearica TaxID=74829 RepID=UPI0028AECCE0
MENAEGFSTDGERWWKRFAVFHPTRQQPTPNAASPSRFVHFTRQSMDYSALREALGSREDSPMSSNDRVIIFD